MWGHNIDNHSIDGFHIDSHSIDSHHINSYGIDIVEQVPIVIEPNSINKQYLDTKRDRLGHSI